MDFKWLLSELMKMKMVFVSLTLITKLFFCRPGPSAIDFIQENESRASRSAGSDRNERMKAITDISYSVDTFRLLFILYDYFKGVCSGMSRFSTSYCDELLRERVTVRNV